jgi:hypothetical protein
VEQPPLCPHRKVATEPTNQVGRAQPRAKLRSCACPSDRTGRIIGRAAWKRATGWSRGSRAPPSIPDPVPVPEIPVALVEPVARILGVGIRQRCLEPLPCLPRMHTGDDGQPAGEDCPVPHQVLQILDRHVATSRGKPELAALLITQAGAGKSPGAPNAPR